MDGARFDHTGGRRGAWTAAGVLCLAFGLVRLFWVGVSAVDHGPVPVLKQFAGIDQADGDTIGVDRSNLLYALLLLVLAVMALTKKSAARGGILVLGWLLLYDALRYVVSELQDDMYLEGVLDLEDFERSAVFFTEILSLILAIVLIALMMSPGRLGKTDDQDENDYDDRYQPPPGFGQAPAGPPPPAYHQPQQPGQPPGYPHQSAYPGSPQPSPYAAPPRPPQYQQPQPRHQQPPGYAPPPPPDEPTTQALPQHRPDERPRPGSDDDPTTMFPRPDDRNP